MELLELSYQCATITGNAAVFAISRFPHPDTMAASNAAFIDVATGRSLSFTGLRQAALSLASGLRLGLGLRRGDAVLVLSPSSLLFLPVVLGILAAGGVVVIADLEATAAEIATVAHDSSAVIIVAAPEVADKVSGFGIPVLLTSQSPDPRAPLSVEELIDGGDPMTLAMPKVAAEQPCPSDVAALVYSSAESKRVSLTHADLIDAIANASSPEEGQVFLVSLPVCDVHGLTSLLLRLPATGVTTVLVSPLDAKAIREAVVSHGVTDIATTPTGAVAIAIGMTQGCDLSKLRRVVVAPALTEVARREFHRLLPWIKLTETSDMMEKETGATAQLFQVAPTELGNLLAPQPDTPTGAVIQQDDKNSSQISITNGPLTNVANEVTPLKKIQKNVFGEVVSESTARKVLRKHLVPWNKQVISKL